MEGHVAKVIRRTLGSVCLLGLACCGTAPTSPEASTSGPSTLPLGDSVMSTVSATDPECDTSDPTVEELRAPCKTFQFTAPRTAVFVARLTWTPPDIFLELLTPAYGRCCTSPLSLSFGVQAGATYTISVGFHGVASGDRMGSAPFELTTSLTE